MAVVSASPNHPIFQVGGVGGAVHNSFPSSNRQGIQKQELFPFGEQLREKLTQNSGQNRTPLSHSSHTAHMEPSKPQRLVLLLLGAFMVCAWALIIWVATEVTRTALDTLSYIVDLAQMQ